MNASLYVEHHPGSIERARADVAVVTLFASELPLRRGAGHADWRLCGQLTRLLVEGRVSGRWGEAVLVPTFGGLRAPLLVALGLGERVRCGSAECRAAAADGVRRGLALGAQTLALSLPEGDALLRDRVEGLVAGAATAVAERGARLTLLMVASPEESARAGVVLGQLRPALPDGLSLRLPGANPRRLGETPAGAGPSSPAAVK